MMRMKGFFVPIVMILATAGQMPGEEPGEVFAAHCAACHALDHALVGPSLVEISGTYREDREGFIAWSMKPGRKRPQSIEMPSMAHLGKDTLAALHAYVVEAAAGKEERKPMAEMDFDQGGRRPRVQRIFLPDASPAAIAVALPGDFSYVFDAAECRVRYVWQGGFMDGNPYWKGNGSSLAEIQGERVYQEDEFPLKWARPPSTDVPKFLGYRLIDGLPTFVYVRNGVRFEERILPLADGSGIERVFSTDAVMDFQVELAEGAVINKAADSRGVTITQRFK
jgi:cytochrome c551/c552